MYKIEGTIKKYDWGTEDFLPEFLGRKPDGKPWAEFWINGKTFLFKVLSIAKPLSVQCHPNDEQAASGFAEGNPNYSGPNGKPEILCAVSEVKARCGIKDGVTRDFVVDVLKNHQNEIELYLDKIMNTVTLRPGQAMYVKPGTLHQYLSGNAVELMNYSDNVIRGGMTPKSVDIEELEKIACLTPQKPIMAEIEKDSFNRDVYITDCDKFELLHAGTGRFGIKEKTDTIALVTDGEADFDSVHLNRGEVLFIPAGSSYLLLSKGSVFFAR